MGPVFMTRQLSPIGIVLELLRHVRFLCATSTETSPKMSLTLGIAVHPLGDCRNDVIPDGV